MGGGPFVFYPIGLPQSPGSQIAYTIGKFTLEVAPITGTWISGVDTWNAFWDGDISSGIANGIVTVASAYMDAAAVTAIIGSRGSLTPEAIELDMAGRVVIKGAGKKLIPYLSKWFGKNIVKEVEKEAGEKITKLTAEELQKWGIKTLGETTAKSMGEKELQQTFVKHFVSDELSNRLLPKAFTRGLTFEESMGSNMFKKMTVGKIGKIGIDFWDANKFWIKGPLGRGKLMGKTKVGKWSKYVRILGPTILDMGISTVAEERAPETRDLSKIFKDYGFYVDKNVDPDKNSTNKQADDLEQKRQDKLNIQTQKKVENILKEVKIERKRKQKGADYYMKKTLEISKIVKDVAEKKKEQPKKDTVPSEIQNLNTEGIKFKKTQKH